MDLDPQVQHEWQSNHRLTRWALDWIEAHADPGDPHPITTALAQLRADEA